MKIFTFDKSHVSYLETDIRPPMKVAITIPVLVDGKDTGIVVYVAQSGFSMKPPDKDTVVVVAAKLLIQNVEDK